MTFKDYNGQTCQLRIKISETRGKTSSPRVSVHTIPLVIILFATLFSSGGCWEQLRNSTGHAWENNYRITCYHCCSLYPGDQCYSITRLTPRQTFTNSQADSDHSIWNDYPICYVTFKREGQICR